MEWVKNIIGMSCYWLISSRSSLFCFRFLFLLHLFCFVSFVFFSWLLSYCVFVFCSMLRIILKIFSLIIVVFCSFLYLIFLLSWRFFLCIFLYSLFYFLLLKVMLSCGAAIFHSSPTSNISVKTVLIIFHYIHLLSFGVAFCFGMGILQYVFFKQFSTQNSSNEFIELGWCLWEFVLFIDKIC